MSDIIEATWHVSLDCDCPNCKEYVDLLDDPEFFYDREFQIAENCTQRTQDVIVYCPQCGHEFKVDFIY